MPRLSFPTLPLGALNAWTRNATTWWQIAFAAPQVIAHRTQRMAAAGSLPSPRDQREFVRMGHEKLEAAHESMVAMAVAMWKAQLRLMGAFATPWMPWWQAMPGLAAAGLRPVHRRVTANARRLGRTRR